MIFHTEHSSMVSLQCGSGNDAPGPSYRLTDMYSPRSYIQTSSLEELWADYASHLLKTKETSELSHDRQKQKALCICE